MSLPIKVFYSYSHKDERYRQELEAHLSALKRTNIISEWHDRKIGAGEEWANEIDQNLETAQIILLLISSDFINSDYCYEIEMKRAMQKHEAKEAIVIPIILRSSMWQGAPFGKLQAVPRNARPIDTWANKDQAWLDVVTKIKSACERFSESKTAMGDTSVTPGNTDRKLAGPRSPQAKRSLWLGCALAIPILGMLALMLIYFSEAGLLPSPLKTNEPTYPVTTAADPTSSMESEIITTMPPALIPVMTSTATAISLPTRPIVSSSTNASNSIPAASVVNTLPQVVIIPPTEVRLIPVASATSTSPALPTETPALRPPFARPSDGMMQLYVQGGTFEMGSEDSNANGELKHNVTLDPYWIDKTEISNYQYNQCVTQQQCQPPTLLQGFDAPDLPVVGVTWNQAKQYCQWVGGDLPTEAQWEHAARGPSNYSYPWGNEFDYKRVNTRHDGSYVGTTSVNSFDQGESDGSSSVGALNMAGNVYEWVNDWYDPLYYGHSPLENPQGPPDPIGTPKKVERGGDWYADPNRGTPQEIVRATKREATYPDPGNNRIGFRCVTSANN